MSFSEKKREKATLSFRSDKQKIMLNSLVFISEEKARLGHEEGKGFLNFRSLATRQLPWQLR